MSAINKFRKNYPVRFVVLLILAIVVLTILLITLIAPLRHWITGSRFYQNIPNGASTIVAALIAVVGTMIGLWVNSILQKQRFRENRMSEARIARLGECRKFGEQLISANLLVHNALLDIQYLDSTSGAEKVREQLNIAIDEYATASDQLSTVMQTLKVLDSQYCPLIDTAVKRIGEFDAPIRTVYQDPELASLEPIQHNAAAELRKTLDTITENLAQMIFADPSFENDQK